MKLDAKREFVDSVPLVTRVDKPMIFLESVYGCQRTECPTKCSGWPIRPEFMPPQVLSNLIRECKNLEIPHIQLYGRGDIRCYPFEDIPDIDLWGCEVCVTNISYYMVKRLRQHGVIVFSRIDNPLDAKHVPISDGYFTVELPQHLYGDAFLDVLIAALELRPFAIKSLDSYMGQSIGCDSRAMGFPPPYDNPSRIFMYTIPSNKCRIPLITYYKENICYLQCISGEQEYQSFTSVKDVLDDNKCKGCLRFPKAKRIYYYD